MVLLSAALPPLGDNESGVLDEPPKVAESLHKIKTQKSICLEIQCAIRSSAVFSPSLNGSPGVAHSAGLPHKIHKTIFLKKRHIKPPECMHTYMQGGGQSFGAPPLSRS